jgi:enolase
VAKYNRLLEIEAELEDGARYAAMSRVRGSLAVPTPSR